ncbi:hypothetical protein M501DRAFT_993182 [Patellaria atrata CBS 101060]|uniref:Clr5 domain-containing protein n=1 Tax=Patellaria atrata CBS 101060 TaxID=1346257 RepID=A0A9P4S9B0_9PEZI|nr:hypothetical protein M501DRAFT_993182 [Patellaria atrata CBS 101060]
MKGARCLNSSSTGKPFNLPPSTGPEYDVAYTLTPHGQQVRTIAGPELHNATDVESSGSTAVDSDVSYQSIVPPKATRVSPAAPRRSRYQNLDWKKQYDEIEKLYIWGNDSLNETMREMKEKHGFNAP